MARIFIENEDAVKEDFSETLDVAPEFVHVERFSGDWGKTFNKGMRIVLIIPPDAILDDGTVLIDNLVAEYTVFENIDVAREYTIKYVKEQMEEDHTMFIPEFVNQFINEEKLRKFVETIIKADTYYDELYAENEDDFWIEVARTSVEIPEDINELTWIDKSPFVKKATKELKRIQLVEATRDPLGYLTERLGEEEGLDIAIREAGFDFDEAARAAVEEDGWEHFVATYDGQSYTTEAGLIYIIRDKNSRKEAPPSNSPPDWLKPF